VRQKKIFLESEGDLYFERNKNFVSKNLDYYSKKIFQILRNGKNNKILEIGCGKGELLNKLSKKKNYKLYGIDPSSKAIKFNVNKKLNLKKGTADKLKFKDNFFNVVIFGFCLYLIDKQLLFKVVSEADRILKSKGYIVIYDFFHEKSLTKKYSHNKKIKTHKMDFSKLFLSHPFYNLVFKKIGHHLDILRKSKSTKDNISFFIIRKNAK